MVTGVQSLRRRLKYVPRDIEYKLKPVLQKYAEQIVAQMKALVPVDQGDLRDSINWTFGKPPKGAIVFGGFKGADLRVKIYAGGGDAFHAGFQEFGTQNMPASPYFFVVWRANRSRVKAGITRTIRKHIARV